MLGSLGARARGMSCFGEALGTLLRLPAGAANDSEVLPLLAASRIWEPGLMAFKKKKKIVTLRHLGYFFLFAAWFAVEDFSILAHASDFLFKEERKAEFLRKACSSSWGFWESRQNPNKPHHPEGGVNLRHACVSPPREGGSGKEEQGRAVATPVFKAT